MTKRYFYDLQKDLGAVIHMLKHGVKYEIRRPTKAEEKPDFIPIGIDGEHEISMIVDCYELGIDKIYVSPESEHIFDYQIGDRVAYMGDVFGTLTEGDEIEMLSQTIGIDRVNRRNPKAKIEFKNNKQFFMPEVEEIND